MKRSKRERGITLVALVITIIVMLILVGVTVAVAIQGDLFNIAGTAKEKTMEEAEKEKLWAAAMASVNETGKVIFSRLDSENLPKETFEGSNGIYTSKESGKTYLIDEYGNIIVQEGEVQVDFEKVEGDLVADSAKYLEQARTLGQKTTTDVAIGTNGKVVNLDLWKYQKNIEDDNTVRLQGDGCGNGAYIGEITEDGKIQGTIPQLIYSEGQIYKVTNMTDALDGLTELQIAPEIPNTVTNASYMFQKCASLTEAPTIPSSVTDASYMFRNCTSLSKAPIISENITNVVGMFSGCSNLTQPPIIPSTITNTSSMFSGCTNLTELPIIPSSVKNTSSMFSNCTSLTKLPIIPSSVTDTSWMFSNCTSLTQAPIIPDSVTDVSYMFFSCKKLTQAPTIPSNVTNTSSMFRACESLKGEIIINASNISNYNSMLSGVGSQENQIVLKGANTQLEAIKKTGNATYITVLKE